MAAAGTEAMEVDEENEGPEDETDTLTKDTKYGDFHKRFLQSLMCRNVFEVSL